MAKNEVVQSPEKEQITKEQEQPINMIDPRSLSEEALLEYEKTRVDIIIRNGSESGGKDPAYLRCLGAHGDYAAYKPREKRVSVPMYVYNLLRHECINHEPRTEKDSAGRTTVTGVDFPRYNIEFLGLSNGEAVA